MGASEPTTLNYEFGSLNPHDSFDGATPRIARLGSWECALDKGRLTAITVDSFDSEQAATASLEPTLRAWETAAYLRDQYEIYFRAESASDEDDPAAGSTHRDHVFRRVNEAYPAPDPNFTRTAQVENLLALIRRFMDGSVTLPAAVGELVAAAESLASGAGGSIADAYNIDPAVVETLNELSDRGANSPAGTEPSYRGPEWQWMQEGLRLVTLQVGRRTDEPPAVRLLMADFRTRL